MQGSSQLKVGVYIDVANLAMNGGFGMRYDVLREFSCRGSAEPIRLNAYVSYDAERADTDLDYKNGQKRFHAALRDVGYKVIQKDVKWYSDDTGRRFGKANVDLDLAVDALLQSQNMDRVIIATGDGDFVQVVRALQNRGCRVEIIAFDNVSGDLRREADLFMSGYLIPNLLPVKHIQSGNHWAAVNSYARGVCYAYDETKGYGWLRYLRTFEGDLWRTDSREESSPYRTIYFHSSQLPHNVDKRKLTDRQVVFEFRIVPGKEEGQLQAVDLEAFFTIT